MILSQLVFDEKDRKLNETALFAVK